MAVLANHWYSHYISLLSCDIVFFQDTDSSNLPTQGPDHGESQPRLTPLSHPYGGYTHPTPCGGIVMVMYVLVLIFLVININSSRAVFDGCALRCGPILHNIIYLNVSQSLCCFFL